MGGARLAPDLEAVEPAGQETQLQGQQTALEAKLASFKSEKQNLTKSCADLQKIATQIPSVESPTDIDAEESSFESQFNGLAARRV